MPRIARVVAPGLPHHLTQRGNRRQRTFFAQDDYDAYIDLVAEWCDACGVAVWSYCLMPNHVHLIVVPESADGLRRAIGEAHRRYTRRVNFRKRWRGHLWQGRFASCVLDEPHLLAAARYVEMNPVRAGLVDRGEDYRRSSAPAHIKRRDDRLVRVAPLLELTGPWRRFLRQALDPQVVEQLRKHERTGRPLGADSFIAKLEKRLGRGLRPGRPGRKPNPDYS
jgi:putative transposase